MGRGPSPQKTEATRARLLTAAEAILAEGGYSAFTMKELAERAGCAVGLAYRYFPSREALVVLDVDDRAGSLVFVFHRAGPR